MAIYFVVIIIFIFFSILELKLGQRRKKEKFIIEINAFGIMVALAVLRSKTVGGDLINYEQSFWEWRNLSFGNIWTIKTSNVGFVLLNWLIGRFTDSVYGLMIVLAILTYTFLFWMMKVYSKNIPMSLLIFIALGGFADVFSGLRQTLAVAIVFWSVSRLMKKKYMQYIFWLFIAITIHATAFVGIFYGILVFTKKKNIFYTKWLVLIMGTAITAMAGIPFLVNLYSINDYSLLIVRGEGGKLLLLMSGVLFLCFLRIRHLDYQLANIEIVAYNSCMVGIALQVLALGFSLLTRLTSYYFIFFTILIPNLVMEKGKNKSMVAITVMLAAIIYGAYIIHIDLSGIVPYKFIWQ
ncbi:EpsG family protein [bacterium]|nr:EpsG family protein [bacterium]